MTNYYRICLDAISMHTHVMPIHFGIGNLFGLERLLFYSVVLESRELDTVQFIYFFSARIEEEEKGIDVEQILSDLKIDLTNLSEKIIESQLN